MVLEVLKDSKYASFEMVCGLSLRSGLMKAVGGPGYWRIGRCLRQRGQSRSTLDGSRAPRPARLQSEENRSDVELMISHGRGRTSKS